MEVSRNEFEVVDDISDAVAAALTALCTPDVRLPPPPVIAFAAAAPPIAEANLARLALLAAEAAAAVVPALVIRFIPKLNVGKLRKLALDVPANAFEFIADAIEAPGDPLAR